MKSEEENILEQFQFEKGLDVDVEEGYPKIISSQFGGDPGRGFKELVQNSLDSYSSDVPMEERKGEIQTSSKMISITDYGSGMDMDQLKLLLTLGGTDKDKDPDKIGMFGIGFFSIFNPALKTKKVEVLTRCEGEVVKLTFTITDPQKKPVIEIQTLDEEINFSTKISVWFHEESSVQRCLGFAHSSLKYYPCNFSINGYSSHNIWEEARGKGLKIYKEPHVSGFLEKRGWHENVNVLSKYEYIKSIPLYIFPKGGYDICGDLRDYESKEIPFLSGYSATINNNLLRLTISRDSYYLDVAFNISVDLLQKMMMEKLDELLDNEASIQLVIANQYILRNKIREYLDDPENYQESDEITASVVKKLAEYPSYDITDKLMKVSLMEMKKKLSDDLPLFFSENNYNLRWLGGEFSHDFIVSPDSCHICSGAPNLYNTLFTGVFGDVVDLDNIQNDNKKICELVERKIVSRKALTPNVNFVGEAKLSREQMELLIEINDILCNEDVKDAISTNIKISINSIKATFFEVKEEGAYISTGLFSDSGEPLSEEFISNFKKKDDKDKQHISAMGNDILLGLRLDHPFINLLAASKNRHRAYYTITYIAHELAMCQKLLVPFSPFYHFVKERTATAMRKALLEQMLNNTNIT